MVALPGPGGETPATRHSGSIEHMTKRETEPPVLRPVSLQAAADRLGPEIDKRLLYREHRAGRLRAWKFGRRLFTSEGDIQDWIALCRENSPTSAATAKRKRAT